MPVQTTAGIARLSHISGPNPYVPLGDETGRVASTFDRAIQNISSRRQKKLEDERKRQQKMKTLIDDFDTDHWLRHQEYFQEAEKNVWQAGSALLAAGADIDDYTIPTVKEYKQYMAEVEKMADYSKQIETDHLAYQKLKPEDRSKFTSKSLKEQEDFLYKTEFKQQLEAYKNGTMPLLDPKPNIDFKKFDTIVDEMNKGVRVGKDKEEVDRLNSGLDDKKQTIFNPYKKDLIKWFGDEEEADAFIDTYKAQISQHSYDPTHDDTMSFKWASLAFKKKQQSDTVTQQEQDRDLKKETAAKKSNGTNFTDVELEDDFMLLYNDLIKGKKEAIDFFSLLNIGNLKLWDGKGTVYGSEVSRSEFDALAKGDYPTEIKNIVFTTKDKNGEEGEEVSFDLTHPSSQKFRGLYKEAVILKDGLYNKYGERKEDVTVEVKDANAFADKYGLKK